MNPNNSHAIIIGSMKSGTSSLYNYLIEHPKICKAITKEPEYFSENQGHGIHVDKYEELWDFDSNTHQIALEASTGYTKYPLEKNVPKNIFDYGINPKFIYLVRNPIDRILSQYHFVKNNPNWENLDIISEQTISLSSYFLQLSQFRKYFPKENILILDFDELSENPIETTNKVFDFLGIDHFSITNYRVHHKTVVLNNSAIIIKQKLGFFIRILPSSFNKKIKSFLFKNTKKKALTKKEIRILRTKLSKDMNNFKIEYNFDVTKWGF